MTVIGTQMLQFDGGIEFDLIDTWPGSLRRLLDDSLDLLRAYEQGEERQRRMRDEHFMSSLKASPNPYKARRDVVVEAADGCLVGKEIVGFHCTRLTEGEAKEIETEGLEPLTPELLERRIRRCVECNEFSSEMAEALLAKHQADEEGRRDWTSFVYSRSILKDEPAVYWLFRCWGGEALYSSHAEDAETGPALRSVGRPCIVVVAVPVASFPCYASTGECFVRTFLNQRGVKTGMRAEYTGNVRMPIGPESVKTFIFHGDDEFEELTGCSGWRRQIE